MKLSFRWKTTVRFVTIISLVSVLTHMWRVLGALVTYIPVQALEVPLQVCV
jgi:hypothetical protein